MTIYLYNITIPSLFLHLHTPQPGILYFLISLQLSLIHEEAVNLIVLFFINSMDPNYPITSSDDFINSFQIGEDGTILLYDQNLNQQYENLFGSPYQNFAEQLTDEMPLNKNTSVEAASATTVVDPSLEDTDFLETAKFITQILMEENVDQRPFYDPFSLQVTEKSFYEALRENLPLSPNQHPLDVHQDSHSPNSGSTSSSNSSNNNNSVDDNSIEFMKPPNSSDNTLNSGDHVFEFKSHAISKNPSTASYNTNNGMLDLDSSITKLLAQNIFSDSDSVSQFRRGLEEASKFLPPGPQLVTGLKTTPTNTTTTSTTNNVSLDSKGDRGVGLKSRKHHELEEGDDDTEEGRRNKQSAISGIVDETELSYLFDKVLLSVEKLPLCGDQPHEAEKASKPSTSEGGKGRPKRQGKKKETVDLRTLLVLCAQAVSANDNRTANELLKQIRQHSTVSGDATQRLAHYFANGLEARLLGNGAGAQLFYTSPSSKKMTAAEYLKAYKVFLAACPYKKFADFFANKMIMKAAQKAETLHIIDFGILYGFQWPILIQFLSQRENGPPKLRITGIEFPQSGFRPAERLEETGRRLASYCDRFEVPFEYHAIASRNWETIEVEDLKIQSNEFLAVNCMMRFKNLMDETIEVNSPRDAVLQLIRKINPDIFVQSIVNGSYNAPFFATRFREALFHFSAIYDMCDTVIPRENEKRMLIEREIVGREAMNVVACEGFQRIERPETYKQWQARNTRAGFKQLPLNEELMAKFRAKIKQWYHRDFVIDEDNKWMLQGWKGRILNASSCWVPA